MPVKKPQAKNNPQPGKSKSKPSRKDIFKDRKYIYAVGRRKTTVATIRLYAEGKGRYYVNDQEFRKYFGYFAYAKIMTKPLDLLKIKQTFDASIKIKGGGKAAQAEACRLAIARALVKFDPEHRPKLKPLKFLTRDSRKKERKKPGLKRARRAPQWAKR